MKALSIIDSQSLLILLCRLVGYSRLRGVGSAPGRTGEEHGGEHGRASLSDCQDGGHVLRRV